MLIQASRKFIPSLAHDQRTALDQHRDQSTHPGVEDSHGPRSVRRPGMSAAVTEQYQFV
jgi:hypothetical protein